MTRIREIPDEESKKEEQTVKQAAHLSDFYRSYGRALSKPDANDHAGEWEGPKCKLKVTIQDSNFAAEGTYIVERGLGLSALYSPFAYQESAVKSEKYTVKYKGRVSGYTIKAVMTEEGQSSSAAPTTLLGVQGKSGRNVLMVISDSCEEIRVCDQKESEENRWYVLRMLKKQ